MAQFSIGDASVEGFRQIARHWRLTLGWAAFLIVGLIGLIVLVAVITVGLTGAGLIKTGGAGMLALGLLIFLGICVLLLMVQSAAWRVLIRPDAPPGFLNLRLGPDELRLAGYYAVLLALYLALLVAPALVSATTPTLKWPAVIAGIVLTLLGGWLALRLSLTGPMIFAEHRIGLAASWRLTRGRVWVLLGTAVLTFVFLLIAALLENVALAGFAIGTMGFSGLQAMVRPDASQPGHFMFSVVQLLVQMLIYPAFILIWQAPLAMAWRAFSAPDET
jgi:hypothetical protein